MVKKFCRGEWLPDIEVMLPACILPCFAISHEASTTSRQVNKNAQLSVFFIFIFYFEAVDINFQRQSSMFFVVFK